MVRSVVQDPSGHGDLEASGSVGGGSGGQPASDDAHEGRIEDAAAAAAGATCEDDTEYTGGRINEMDNHHTLWIYIYLCIYMYMYVCAPTAAPRCACIPVAHAMTTHIHF